MGVLFLLLILVLFKSDEFSSSQTVDVFSSAEIFDGIKQFRIPALIKTAKGTLIAFAEARTQPQTDCGYKW